ncbi:hypothetical protein POM88_029395 [Heracleum sosnowskyi]|uniref:Uncharacterized protein n=1 Tax=Heracleum sosnowskyi TaxID=360622 RepID=A0AAD8MHP6_9APIA|nr:hypothetical protein POM88_029395 [Heracleum sosnowskyi]
MFKVNWEPVLFYPNRKVLPNLVTEFYNNMQVRDGAHNVVFVTSVVDNQHIILDHAELGKALNLSTKMLDLANINIFKEYVFNKNLDSTVVLPLPSAQPSTSVPPMNFRREFTRLQEAHTELDVMLKSLQEAFQKLVTKYEATKAKVAVLVEILGNTVTRVGRIEDGLSQMIDMQLGLVDIPFLPLIEEMARQPERANVVEEMVGSGVVSTTMDTYVVDTLVINNPVYETMD